MTLNALVAARVPTIAPERPPLPRVLYCLALNPGSKFGSMEEQIVFLAESFRREGSLFLPLFVTHADADVTQFREHGIDARCLELRRFSMGTLARLCQLVKNQRIDVINWNFMPALRNSYAWALSLLTPRTRHWFTDHNSRPAEVHPCEADGICKIVKRGLLKRYGRVLCVSRFVEENLQARGTWSNLVCTRHFVNTERFQPDESVRRATRARMNVGNRLVLLTVSHLIREKGVDVAIRALSELPSEVMLWIIGDGPEKPALERLIGELKLEGRARLLGLQRQVQPFMQAADCYLCPSVWAEAAGLVNLEAQACATPVIASRIGGIPEYVADGQTGLLFTPGDHHDLARCVRRLLEEPGLCASLAQAGRLRAVRDFSPAARLPEWLDLYRNWRSSSNPLRIR